MQLHGVGLDLEQEDDAAGFLEVRMERDPTTGLLNSSITGSTKHQHHQNNDSDADSIFAPNDHDSNV